MLPCIFICLFYLLCRTIPVITNLFFDYCTPILIVSAIGTIGIACCAKGTIDFSIRVLCVALVGHPQDIIGISFFVCLLVICYLL